MALDLTREQKQALTDYFQQFVTLERQQKIEAVLAQRTRYLTVMVDDFHSTQNCSAILRTCEGLGIQDIHIVENQTPFKVNRDVTRNCQKWLTLYRYNQRHRDNTIDCLEGLRSQGYRLVATSPHAEAFPPEVLPLDKKVAILLGNEQAGLTDGVLQQADWTIKIPMVGFSESFNVSVSAALCLYSLTHRIRSSPFPWQISPLEQLDLRLDWYKRSSRSSDYLEQRFLKRRGWLPA